MTSRSFGSRPSEFPWSTSTPLSDRSYLTAAVRAGIIALVLLGILALLLWL
jgi:hypothetical protein